VLTLVLKRSDAPLFDQGETPLIMEDTPPTEVELPPR